jgi:hypothetical protein
MSSEAKRSKKSTRQVESKASKIGPNASGARLGGRNGAAATHGAHPARAAANRSDPGTAFLPDPYDRTRPPARAGDPLAESLAEEYIASATSAEDIVEDDRDEVRPEELGGPFTETTGREEFANDTDESNPEDAAREPFPTATRLPN